MTISRQFLFVFLTIFLNVTILLAQPPDTVWTRTYGGSGQDWARSVCETSDSGLIIVGTTDSFGAGERDVYVIRTDSFGDTLWTRTYGGEEWDLGASILQSANGEYVITGYTFSYGAGSCDLYLLKIDSAGDTVWTKTYGGENWDSGVIVRQGTDGGYIILGDTESFGSGYHDIWLLKTNEVGDTLWTKTFGGDYSELAGSVSQTSDDGYIIAGTTDLIPSMTYVYLIKTDSRGDRLWSRSIPCGDEVLARSVAQTSDGGYIVGVSSFSYSDYDWDICLLKTYPNGDSAWARIFGGAESDQVFSIGLAGDGGYVLGGFTESLGAGSEDVYVIKTDSQGIENWSAVYGGTSDDRCYSVSQASDEGYVIAGSSYSFGEGNGDAWLLRLDSETGLSGKEVESLPWRFTFQQNYPNPFNPSTTISYRLPEQSDISLSVFNLLGQQVATIYDGSQVAGEHRVTWDASAFPSSVYFVKLEAGGWSETVKMVLLK